MQNDMQGARREKATTLDRQHGGPPESFCLPVLAESATRKIKPATN